MDIYVQDIALSMSDVNTIVNYLVKHTRASSTTALNYVMFLNAKNQRELKNLMYRVYISLRPEEKSIVPSYPTTIKSYEPY